MEIWPNEVCDKINRKKRKGYLEEKNCQQNNYLGGQIKGMMKNIGESQNGIESDRKVKKENEL